MDQLVETVAVLLAYKAEWCYHNKRKDLEKTDWCNSHFRQKEKAWTAGIRKRLAIIQKKSHADDWRESGLFKRLNYIKEPLKQNTLRSHRKKARQCFWYFCFVQICILLTVQEIKNNYLETFASVYHDSVINERWIVNQNCPQELWRRIQWATKS